MRKKYAKYLLDSKIEFTFAENKRNNLNLILTTLKHQGVMTQGQRVFISILAGVAYAVIMGMAGGHPNGAQIALVITLTAAFTRRFKKCAEDDE